MPLVVAAVLLVVATIALFRLPEAFVEQFENRRTLTDSQAGWAYRLLALAALGQAAYGGFVVLSVERVARERGADERLAASPPERVVRLLDRTAAVMVVLTVVYGVASFVTTGERGGYWLFLVIAMAQAAWYRYQIARVEHWLRFQPEPAAPPSPDALPVLPADHVPPIARVFG